MNKKEVKVFDAYSVKDSDEKYYKELGIPSYALFDYHNQILRKDGTIKPLYNSIAPNCIKPLEQNIVTKTKYELDDKEQVVLSMLKHSVKKAKDLYDSCERKYNKYEHLLISSLPIEDTLYDGEYWKCNLSPVGRCIYKIDSSGESVCVFCGEPEERK